MFGSLLEHFQSESYRIHSERLCFVEEQNIRRSLGPAKWQELCGEIHGECDNVNAQSARFAVKQLGSVLTVKDLQTAKRLRLAYDSIGTCIHVEESGRPDRNITFRVDKEPAPELMLMLNGSPSLPRDAALDLIIGLTGE